MQVCGGWQHEYEAVFLNEEPSPLPCRPTGVVPAGGHIWVLGDVFLSLPYVSVVLRWGRTILMAGGALREHCPPFCVLLRNNQEGIMENKILNQKDTGQWSWQGEVIGVGG